MMNKPSAQRSWIGLLDERQVGRQGTGQRVADLICDKILDGTLKPGLQLPEESLCKSLNVSRNTLREAFRILDSSRLVIHLVGRGVFVRTITASDVIDIYLARKVIEPSAILMASRGAADVGAVVREAEACIVAGQKGDWAEVGAADIRFHRAIVALAHSPRLDAIAVQLTLETRLIFHASPNLADFHRRYLDRNVKISEALLAGHFKSAADELVNYLDDAESEIVQLLAGNE